jgi:hypothetical protein
MLARLCPACGCFNPAVPHTQGKWGFASGPMSVRSHGDAERTVESSTHATPAHGNWYERRPSRETATAAGAAARAANSKCITFAASRNAETLSTSATSSRSAPAVTEGKAQTGFLREARSHPSSS